jgi:hypothetical protein
MKSLNKRIVRVLATAVSVAALGTLITAATPTAAMAHDRDDNYSVQRWHREAPVRDWSRYHREADRDDYPVVCDRDGDDCAPNPAYEGRYYPPAQPYGYNYNAYPVFRGWY